MAMSGQERKAALVLRGKKVTDIAARIGVTQGHVSSVLSGRYRSSRVEQAIADAIGKPVSKVFPPQPSAA